MSDLQLQIQDQLDNALPSDVIQLPNQTLNFPIIISKPCTVLGQGNTVIDVSEIDEQYAVEVIADSVVMSDLSIINKNDAGYHGLHAKTSQSSFERLGVSCDSGIVLEKSDSVDLIEIRAFNANTGIKIIDSMNLELNACDAYNCSIGLDIIGSSSVKGNVDSYQSFGLSVQPTDTAPLTTGQEYGFEVDGITFSFSVNQPMTYQDVVDSINSLIGFNPTYTAEIKDGDIYIKTQNDSIQVESGSSARNLLAELSAPLNPAENNHEWAYAPFGLSINGSDVAPIDKNVLYTFELDDNEIQFYSPETDGTTYDELVGLLQDAINDHEDIDPDEYTVEIHDGDIRIVKDNVPSVVLTNGTRFKDLFAQLGITTIPYSVRVIESYQTLGLNITATDTTPLDADAYSFIINDIEYIFNIPTANPTYSTLVTIMNSNAVFNDKYTASIEDEDIKILTGEDSIEIEDKDLSLFSALGASLGEPVVGSEENRTDRSHHINIIGSLLHENQIGARLINANNIVFEAQTKVFSNTNIGIWQMPSSYDNKFRGEIYNNTNYGLRNTDKQGGPHIFNAMDSWWGDMTGPSMFGSGEGDKISSNVTWQPQRQTGTVPDLNYPKTREFVLGALGYPVVKVELTDEQIEQCIEKAIFKFMQYRTPEPMYRYINVGAGQPLVELPLDLPKEEVIEVIYSPNADIFAQLSGAGESFYLTYYLQNTGGTFLSDFYVAMAYKETMETTLGIRPTYEFVSGQKPDGSYADFIRLAPRPDGNISLGILYSRPMTEEEIDNKDWIHKYTLAWAKEYLGRIRSKFGSVPGPTGEMQLDGQTLLAEAQQERQSLEESVMLRGQPLGFTTG